MSRGAQARAAELADVADRLTAWFAELGPGTAPAWDPARPAALRGAADASTARKIGMAMHDSLHWGRDGVDEGYFVVGEDPRLIDHDRSTAYHETLERFQKLTSGRRDSRQLLLAGTALIVVFLGCVLVFGRWGTAVGFIADVALAALVFTFVLRR